MQITGLDHYNIRVPDAALEALCRFYVEVLGLQPGPRPPFRTTGFWLYAGDKPLLHLTGFAAETAEIEARQTGWFSHIAFGCRDCAAAVARLKSHGVEYQVDEVPEIGQTQLFFTDPAGIGVELNFNESAVPDE
ncbi:MAG TPA: VOC family protein [Gammaproteobacteria bacterium]|nr:VOC family protein [Gammaproteobacteria bacterium]